MTYQVLARKYRPRFFDEMRGQEHVLQSLINSLKNQRLHHAYLFTGTRGVGKTTTARILAKCLNCEQGITPKPCGQCSACLAINEGRFVDLIEVDAASRTKVEDTRELLDNVQYAPSNGRFKVYLIDEVHMLSSHSFNALLKTLEEPPSHVKFLLATTDPQKIPVTILSRCLQYSLRNMVPEHIVLHLEDILQKELIQFETQALWHLSQAAEGSMRDALSLTDQAISFGNGVITEQQVCDMLGSVSRGQVLSITRKLLEHDTSGLLALISQIAQFAPNYDGLLAEMLGLLHRLAIAQAVPQAVSNELGDKELVVSLASQVSAEDLQLFYQTGLLGRKDLNLAPNQRDAFEMVLLRMLAFRPMPPESIVSTDVLNEIATASVSASRSAPQQYSPSNEAPEKEVSKKEVVEKEKRLANEVDAGQPQNTLPTSSGGQVAPLTRPQQTRQPTPPLVSASVNEPVANNEPVVNVAEQLVPSDMEPMPPMSPEDYAPSYDVPEIDAPATQHQGASPTIEPSVSADTPVMGKAKAALMASISESQLAESLVDVAVSPDNVAVAPDNIETASGPASVEAVLESSVSPLKVGFDNEAWIKFQATLSLSGMSQNLAANSVVLEWRTPSDLVLGVDESYDHLVSDSQTLKIQRGIETAVGENVKLHITTLNAAASSQLVTPAAFRAKIAESHLKNAEQAIHQDPNVQMLVTTFGGHVISKTIISKHSK